MKCLIIDKTPYEAYVEMPDGMIVSVSPSVVSSSSIGDNIFITDEVLTYPSQNSPISSIKLVDFF